MFLKTCNLLNAVNYESNELDSKVIAQDGERKILLFALPKNVELERHTSPVDAYIYVYEGKINFKTDECDYVINCGEMFGVPKDLIHSVSAIEDSKFSVTRL